MPLKDGIKDMYLKFLKSHINQNNKCHHLRKWSKFKIKTICSFVSYEMHPNNKMQHPKSIKTI